MGVAGEVYYDAQQFLLKNKDTLAQDIVDLLAASSNPLVRDLFREDSAAPGDLLPPLSCCYCYYCCLTATAA